MKADAKCYRALELIYDTAVRPGAWRRALDATAHATEAEGAILVIRGKRAVGKDLSMVSSRYLDFSRTPAGWYYNAWLSRHQNQDWDFLKSQPALQPIPDLATGLDTQQLDNRVDYAFLRKRLGISRRLGVRLNTDTVWFDAISIGFQKDIQSIPNPALQKSRFLIPHLTKALELGRMFTLLKARYKATLTALDKVQAGIVLTLPDGQILVRNAEADRILGLGDGIGLGRDERFIAGEPDLTAKINTVIASVSETAKGRESRAGALIAIPRPSHLDPFLLDIAPISDADGDLDRDLDGALVTLIDPDSVPYLRLERFTKIHGLTGAEEEVCEWILEGFTIAQIAEKRGTSPTTAKNQVASVLSKTGVHSRLELIRLILRVLPPVV